MLKTYEGHTEEGLKLLLEGSRLILRVIWPGIISKKPILLTGSSFQKPPAGQGMPVSGFNFPVTS